MVRWTRTCPTHSVWLSATITGTHSAILILSPILSLGCAKATGGTGPSNQLAGGKVISSGGGHVTVRWVTQCATATTAGSHPHGAEWPICCKIKPNSEGRTCAGEQEHPSIRISATQLHCSLSASLFALSRCAAARGPISNDILAVGRCSRLAQASDRRQHSPVDSELAGAFLPDGFESGAGSMARRAGHFKPVRDTRIALPDDC
jgi:hypothetical protein